MPGTTAPDLPRADVVASDLIKIPADTICITEGSFGLAGSKVSKLPYRNAIWNRINYYSSAPVHSKFINDAVSVFEACLTVEPSRGTKMHSCAETSHKIIRYIIEMSCIDNDSDLASSLMGLGFTSCDDPVLRDKKRQAILELVRVFLGSFEGEEYFDPESAFMIIDKQAKHIVTSALPLPQGLEQPANIVTGEFEETYEYFFTKLEDTKRVTAAELDYTGALFTRPKILERILHEVNEFNIVLENPRSHFLRMRGKPGIFSDNAYKNTVEESIHVLEYFCRKAQKSGRLRARVSLSLTDCPFETALYEADDSLLVFDKRPAPCINRAFIAKKPEDDKFGSYQQNKGIMDNIKENSYYYWTFEDGHIGPDGGPGGGMPEGNGANRDTNARDVIRGLGDYDPELIDVDAEAVIRAVLALYAEEPSPNADPRRFTRGESRSFDQGDMEEMLLSKNEQARRKAIEILAAEYEAKCESAKREILQGLKTILDWTYGVDAFCLFMDTPGIVDYPAQQETRFFNVLSGTLKNLEKRGVVQVQRLR